MSLIRVMLATACALMPGWIHSATPVIRVDQCSDIPAQCEVSASLYDFGRHEISSITPPIRTQGSISVTCTKLALPGFLVSADIELQGLPPEESRNLRGKEGDELTYGLFLDAALTRVWGDGTGGTRTISDVIEMRGTNRVVTRTYLLFGRVNGGQTGRPGRYLGAVASRLNYRLTCK